jgi:hypothetical protein
MCRLRYVYMSPNIPLTYSNTQPLLRYLFVACMPRQPEGPIINPTCKRAKATPSAYGVPQLECQPKRLHKVLPED